MMESALLFAVLFAVAAVSFILLLFCVPFFIFDNFDRLITRLRAEIDSQNRQIEELRDLLHKALNNPGMDNM